MTLINLIKLTEENEKITLVIKGVETSETKSLTPQLLAKNSENTVEHVTVDGDAMVVTIKKEIESKPLKELPNCFGSWSST